MGQYLIDDNFIAQFKQVWRWFRANILGGNGQVLQSINRPTIQYDSLRVVKLTSADSTGGRYNAKSCVGTIDTSSTDWTGGTSLPAGMVVNDDEDVLAINPAENGADTHALDVDTDTSFYLGKFVGATSDGKRIVVICASPASPAGMIPVALTSDGGSGTPITYTYTVKSLDGATTYGEAMTPLYRPIYAGGTAATKGVGYFDGGTFVLWMSNETYLVTPECP